MTYHAGLGLTAFFHECQSRCRTNELQARRGNSESRANGEAGSIQDAHKLYQTLRDLSTLLGYLALAAAIVAVGTMWSQHSEWHRGFSSQLWQALR